MFSCLWVNLLSPLGYRGRHMAGTDTFRKALTFCPCGIIQRRQRQGTATASFHVVIETRDQECNVLKQRMKPNKAKPALTGWGQMLTICEPDSHGQPGKSDPQWRTQNCAACFGLLETYSSFSALQVSAIPAQELCVTPHLSHWMCGTQGFCDGKECKIEPQFQWICCLMYQSSGGIWTYLTFPSRSFFS